MAANFAAGWDRRGRPPDVERCTIGAPGRSCAPLSPSSTESPSMKMLRTLLIVGTVLGLAGWAASRPAAQYLEQRNRPNFRQVEVVRRTISAVVNSSGEVKPVLSVSIGSFVSGPITKLHVDFNDRVKKNQLMAEIDPQIYIAAVEGARAALVTREADVVRVKALLQQAINDEKR